MNDDSISIGPVKTAWEVGSSLAGDLGSTAFVELELSFANRLLPKFFDDPIIRKNQNLLFYWQPGYYKSTILKTFSQTIPECYKYVDITSMTQEKIFGSIDEKRRLIIQPAFTNDIHFVLIPELTSVLGQRDSMRQFVNIMNAVLENERVSRQTLKLGHEVSQYNLQGLSEKGVSFDAAKGELSYVPNVSVFAASRPLDNKYFTYLDKSGHFGRYHVIQKRITDEEASKHLHTEFTIDQKALAALAEVNLQLSKVRVSRVLRPSADFLKPVYDDLEALIDDEIAERNLTFSDVFNPRLKDDLIRELTAFSFLRRAKEEGYIDIEELEFAQKDLDFIRLRLPHFVEFVTDPLIAEDFTTISKRRSKLSQCSEEIIDFLKDGDWHDSSKIIFHVESKFALRRQKISQATIYQSLKTLEDSGKIIHEQGRYKLAQTV
ncbi:MAG: hypothetical protein NWE80_02385 [Candidatus Bathyarchaeota archaeon]|nr:hypothetical protein [Candidatus Bathyarchaeota archaeon]